MSFFMLVIYFCSAILLYFVIRFFEKGFTEANDKSLQLILLPVVYITIFAGILDSLNITFSHIYLIVVFYIFLRYIMKTSIFLEEALFDKKYFFLTSIITVFLSYGFDAFYISKVNKIFPTANEVKGEIWILILIFLYIFFKDKVKRKEVQNQSSLFLDKEDYIVTKYALFKNTYFNIVTNPLEKPFFKDFIYAIMIYENYMCSPLQRRFMLLKYKVTKQKVPMGIMQIESKKWIDDDKSIELAIRKIIKIIEKISVDKRKIKDIEFMRLILNDYKKIPGYSDNIMVIYETIEKFNQK